MYPELPESAASLTSLLGLILVTELTRGGAAHLNALNTTTPCQECTHLACSNETDPRKLFVLDSHKWHVHEQNEILLNLIQDWEQNVYAMYNFLAMLDHVKKTEVFGVV